MFSIVLRHLLICVFMRCIYMPTLYYNFSFAHLLSVFNHAYICKHGYHRHYILHTMWLTLWLYCSSQILYLFVLVFDVHIHTAPLNLPPSLKPAPCTDYFLLTPCKHGVQNKFTTSSMPIALLKLSPL